MSYCRYCGAPLSLSDAFCPKCGAKAVENNVNMGTDAYEENQKENVCCELAYTGFLFWIPLVVCPKHRYAKYCANQGIWLLILSVLACTVIRILSGANELLSGGGIGIIAGGVYSLIHMLFLLFMLCMVWQCIRNVMAVHRGGNPKAIFFFDLIRIIQ